MNPSLPASAASEPYGAVARSPVAVFERLLGFGSTLVTPVSNDSAAKPDREYRVAAAAIGRILVKVMVAPALSIEGDRLRIPTWA